MPREAAPGGRDEPSLEFLRKGHWFGGLPEDLRALILAQAHIRPFRKGSALVRQGALAKGLFAVLEGRVRVVRDVSGSVETLIHVGEAGFWFGEHSLLSGAPAVASIVAATHGQALVLPTEAFERIVSGEPRYYRCFARLLIERYATIFRYASEAKGMAAEQWLRTRLRDLAAMRRLDAPGEGPVDIAVSQSELASMIGVSRQTLCMLLGRLQDRGLIEVKYKRIRVLPLIAPDPVGARAGVPAAPR